MHILASDCLTKRITGNDDRRGNGVISRRVTRGVDDCKVVNSRVGKGNGVIHAYIIRKCDAYTKVVIIDLDRDIVA